MATRDEAIKAIRASLKRRSGKMWSVTGGKGTAWGWITIDAPPARRTWNMREVYGSRTPTSEAVYEDINIGQPGHEMGPDDRAELGNLLGLGRPSHSQGESIPSSSAYYAEYISRADGVEPVAYGTQYWD